MIYRMRLHQIKHPQDSLKIVRVPGGWIYHLKHYAHTTAVFVPYCDEFKGRPDLVSEPMTNLMEGEGP